jgi:hypothetical protein
MPCAVVAKPNQILLPVQRPQRAIRRLLQVLYGDES